MRNSRKQWNSRGFTLVELLVVTLLLSLVAAALGACLTGGIKAWESVQNFNELELNVMPPLLILEKEMMNSIDFYGVEFAGDAQMVQFASVIKSADNSGLPPAIGTIQYYFDKRKHILFRKQWLYPDDEPDAQEVVVSSLNEVSFEYYFVDQDIAGNSNGEWGEFRDKGTNFLGAVRIQLGTDKEDEAKELTRTIVLPYPRLVANTDEDSL
ncbi:hypothetical protein BVX97_00705 [bacterium E08(2017)]|nr:hypothetical protein BVX97_00705 [bacterium E08(2017)]